MTKPPVYSNVFICHVKRTNGVYTVHGSDLDELSQELGLLNTKSNAIKDGKKYRWTLTEVED